MSIVFMVMFGIAALVRYLSYRACTRMFEPAYSPPPDSSFTFWQFVRRAPQSNFVKFVIFVGAFYFGAFVSAPFYIPHVLKVLNREQWEWVIIDIGSTTSALLTFIYWGHFSARFGNKATIAFTSIVISIVPALWILCDNLYWLIAVQCLGGTLWAGFNLSCANYIMEACSPPKRARCFAYYNVFVGAGSFLGAMVGALLVKKANPHFAFAGMEFSVRSSLSYVFIVSVLLRFIPCFYLIRLFRELRKEVQPFAVRDWALEIVGARPALGLRFGAIAEKESDDDHPPTPQLSSEEPKREGVTSDSGRVG
jgi:MFS family permease